MMQVSSTQGFFLGKMFKLISNNTNWLFCHVEVKIRTTLNSEDVLNKAIQKPESNENILRNSK